MSEYSKTAIVWGALKEALVYFEHVIPLAYAADMFFESRDDGIDLALNPPDYQTLNELLPPQFRNEKFWSLNDSLAIALFMAKFHPLNSDRNEAAKLHEALEDSAVALFSAFPALNKLPLISRDCQNEKHGELAVSISAVRLIDPGSVPLKQLLEFRNDADAMIKLRRFRLFAYSNYTGKSRDFIEDDILTRLADYEQAAEKWGFTRRSGTINVLLNSALVAGGIAGSFLTAYCKAPMEAIVSTMSATGVAIANLAINLGQQSFAQKELMANNPVSYISYAKEKLAGK